MSVLELVVLGVMKVGRGLRCIAEKMVICMRKDADSLPDHSLATACTEKKRRRGLERL